MCSRFIEKPWLNEGVSHRQSHTSLELWLIEWLFIQRGKNLQITVPDNSPSARTGKESRSRKWSRKPKREWRTIAAFWKRETTPQWAGNSAAIGWRSGRSSCSSCYQKSPDQKKPRARWFQCRILNLDSIHCFLKISIFLLIIAECISQGTVK